MRKTIISFLAAAVFVFAILFTASPPVAAETGKSFNQAFEARGSAVAIKNAQTAQANFDVADIPISVAANSRKNLREILSENYRENYKTKDLVPITRKTKFSNQTNFSGGGFSGINVDTFARAKV